MRDARLLVEVVAVVARAAVVVNCARRLRDEVAVAARAGPRDARRAAEVVAVVARAALIVGRAAQGVHDEVAVGARAGPRTAVGAVAARVERLARGKVGELLAKALVVRRVVARARASRGGRVRALEGRVQAVGVVDDGRAGAIDGARGCVTRLEHGGGRGGGGAEEAGDDEGAHGKEVTGGRGEGGERRGAQGGVKTRWLEDVRT